MKRTLTLMLAAVLALSLAACSNESETTAETTGEVTAETTTAVTEPPEYTDPELDYGGETFTVAAYNFENAWVLASYIEIFAEEENGDPINDAIYQRNRTVEELLNVKFDHFPIPAMSSTTEISTAVLAGDDVFKIASQNGTGMKNILSGGILGDIASIETLDLEASWWDQKSVEEFDLYGTKYAVTGDFNFYNKGAPITLFFSKKLVEDLTLENPYELVRDGKWVIDTMYEYARTAARDTNGDGVMTAEEDCWGFMGEYTSVRQYVRSADVRLSTRNADGDIEVTLNNEKTVSIVESFIPFIRDKNVCIYAQDYGNIYKSAYSDLMLPRFIDNAAMFFSNQLLVALNLRNMEADFGVLPLPKYNEAQEDYINVSSASWLTLTTLPVTNGDLEMTGHVLNALGYYSQQLITPAFIEQTVLDKTIRDDDSAEMLELIYATQEYDIAEIYNWGNISSIFGTLTGATNTNFASEFAKIENNILTAIEQTVSQLKGE